jgi:hypothetical protein
VIGFVSQFFSSTSVPSARALSAAVPRAQTTAGLARDDSCLEPKHTDGCHLAVSGMTIRILRGVFVDRRYRPKSGNPGVESLTPSRNFIDTAAAAFEGAGMVCDSGHPVRFSGHPSRRTWTMLAYSSRASARTDGDTDRPNGSLTIFIEDPGWWQRTDAAPRSSSEAARAGVGRPRAGTGD